MNKQAFYDGARNLFGGRMTQAQVDGCEVIMAACRGLPISWVAYLLATALHETASTMQPVRETLAESDEGAVNRLESAWKAGRLKWVRTPYWRFDATGKTWIGRGYVQLTHRDNYAKASDLVGVDLVADPSLAMQPSIAAKVLVEGSVRGIFTGKRLADYLPGDYAGARRIINGTDRAALIAGYARQFEAALTAGRWGSGPPPAQQMEPAQPAKSGLFAALIAALAAIIKAIFGERK